MRPDVNEYKESLKRKQKELQKRIESHLPENVSLASILVLCKLSDRIAFVSWDGSLHLKKFRLGMREFLFEDWDGFLAFKSFGKFHMVVHGGGKLVITVDEDQIIRHYSVKNFPDIEEIEVPINTLPTGRLMDKAPFRYHYKAGEKSCALEDAQKEMILKENHL